MLTYTYAFVCVCVCVCERERERERATKFHTHTQQQAPSIPTKSNFYLPKLLATAFRDTDLPTTLTPHFPISTSILLSVSHFKHSVQALSPLYRLATSQIPTASLQSTRSNPKLAGNPRRLTQHVWSHPHIVTASPPPATRGSAVAFRDSHNAGLYANE